MPVRRHENRTAMSVEDIPEPRKAGRPASPPVTGDELPALWTSRFIESYDLLLWATDVHEAAGDRFAQCGRPELALPAWERAAATRAELCLEDRAPISPRREDG
jgi:hypothetical protein